MTNSINKDYSISFIRLMALIFIFICHILQFYNNELAWWFNVGVQMFLFLSGYLYGNKKIDNITLFYKNQFKKILVPYYIFVIVVCGIGFIFAKSQANFPSIFKLLLLYEHGSFSSLAHTWYIPYILICYLITPLLVEIVNNIEKRNNKIIELIIFSVIIIIFFELFVSYFNAAWIIAFWLGIIYTRIVETSKKIKLINFICVITSVILVILQVLIDYIFKIEFQGVLNGIYRRYCNYTHVLLAIALFIILRKFYVSMKINNFKILNITDKYSYEFYLVHHVFILGSFSLFEIFNNRIIGILIIICSTIISAVVLSFLSEKINAIFKIKKKYNGDCS